MPISSARRALLLATAAMPFMSLRAAAADSAADNMTALEKASGGRIGVSAWNTGTRKHFGYRADERFPICSTFKTLLSAAMLARSEREPGLMQQRVAVTAADMVFHAPVTEKHIGTGITIEQLCAAVIEYSDNPGANLLMKQMGGPAGVTAYARSLGDDVFRLDRWETELNTAVPGDLRDTTSPRAMAQLIDKLVFGTALNAQSREKLIAWLVSNKMGGPRIRGAVPAGWKVGDKTGTGAYGSTNDVGVVWPPGGAAPVVLAVYYTAEIKDAKSRVDVVADAARLAIGAVT
ncbi:MAG TPA: class A beta-lactamase [Burkholderiaceae bacterium]